jgi:putative membrane protein
MLAHATGWIAHVPVAAVLAAGAACLWTVRPARRRSAGGVRALSNTERRRVVLFLTGLVVVGATLGGPIETYADELFWVHMVQHVLLLTVAAPSFVLAAPWVLPLRLMPPVMRRRVAVWWRGARSARPIRAGTALLAAPVAAWALFDANLVVWHVPAAFDLTLRSEVVHGVEHLLFLGLGVLFWVQVIDSRPLRRRLGHLQRAMYVTAAAIVGWGLSIALMLAPSALYPGYAGLVSRPAGLSALADQRVAAGVMLVPGSITFALVALVSLIRWLSEAEARTESAPSLAPPVARRVERGEA